MTNPTKQKISSVQTQVGVKMPPVPQSLALDTPSIESRIRLGDLSDDELTTIADEWKEAFLTEAKKQRTRGIR